LIQTIKNLFKKKIEIVKHNPKLNDLVRTKKGDCIDLQFSDIISVNGKSVNFINDSEQETITVLKGDDVFIDLGVSMRLPKNHVAKVYSRSSTFKNTGMMLTNGLGFIDCVYCGTNDRWKAMFLCTRKTTLKRYDRYLQFEIVKAQPDINFVYVNELDNNNRGGYGSTGK
jgi:dUTP pyrophosphatase